MARRVIDRAKLQVRHAEGKTQGLIGELVEVKITNEEGEEKYYQGVVLDVKPDQGKRGTFRVDWINGDDIEWLNMDKEDWKVCQYRPQMEYDRPYTRTEVLRTRGAMALAKAGGGDEVPLAVLERLPLEVIDEFVRILNLSWLTGIMPSGWKEGLLIPVAKPKPGVFRPIALTNAFARWVDKCVTRRYTHWLEECIQAIPADQGGFRRAMSAELQAVATSQWIEDQLQYSSKNKANVKGRHVNLVLLDATSAYDYVRHDTLISRIGALNPPPRMLLWIRGFVCSRRVQTKWGTTRSKWRVMRRGVPQGCSISPILWLTYIAPLSHLLRSGEEDGVAFQLFQLADDITLAIAAYDVAKLNNETAREVAVVEEFCRISFIRLNPTKCNVVTVSEKPEIRKAHVELRINDELVPKVECARLLGLWVDSQLHFAEHAKKARGKCYSKLRVLKYITSRAWGISEKAQQHLVDSYIAPSVTYAAPAWWGTGNTGAVEKVCTAFGACLGLMTGCIQGTKFVDLLELARQEPLDSRVDRQAASLANMAARHRQQTPAKKVLLNPTAKRIRQTRRGWRELAETRLPAETHAKLAATATWPAPWEELDVKWIEAECKKSDPDEFRKAAGEAAVAKAQESFKEKKVIWEIWTDGSVKEEKKTNGPGKGGGGYTITRVVKGGEVEETTRQCVAAGKWATSFTAEAAAATKAAKTTELQIEQYKAEHGDTDEHAALIVSDSLALAKALQGDPYRLKQDTIPPWRAIQSLQGVATIAWVWVSSHCGLKSNDAADELAAKGCDKDQRNVALPSQAVKTHINARTRPPRAFAPPSEEAIRKSGLHPRRAQSWLCQMWGDHCPLTRRFLYKLRKVNDQLCHHPLCMQPMTTPTTNAGASTSAITVPIRKSRRKATPIHVAPALVDNATHVMCRCSAYTAQRLEHLGAETLDCDAREIIKENVDGCVLLLAAVDEIQKATLEAVMEQRKEQQKGKKETPKKIAARTTTCRS